MRAPIKTRRLAIAAVAALSIGASWAWGQSVERQTVLTIEAKEIENAIITEITWDGGLLLLQGVVANPDGQLSARYYVLPAEKIGLKHLPGQPPESQAYWEMKARRLSPTGLGRIEGTSDASLPMHGIAGLEQRIADSVAMGGMQEKHVLRGRKWVISLVHLPPDLRNP